MTDKDGKNVQPELYTEEEIEALESHIEEHFGNYSRVLHEIFSPDIHVDVCLIEPDEERDHYILVTMGMGAHVMNVPEDMADGEHERAELVMCLPADWDLQSHEERWYWPVRLLKTLARIPVSEDSWLGWGHTFEYGDGETFAENTELAAAILLDPSPYDEDCLCELHDGQYVRFYQVFPIFENEKEYKMEYGADALLEALGDRSPVADIDRKPAVDYHPLHYLDDMDWHIASIHEKSLPLADICGLNHMAAYLRWCIEHGLMSSEFIDEYRDIFVDVRKRGCQAPLREFIRDKLKGTLFRELFNKEGIRFARFYYDHDHDPDSGEPCYPADVDSFARQYFGEKRYASDEFKNEAYLFIPFDERYYCGIKKYIEKNYTSFIENK